MFPVSNSVSNSLGRQRHYYAEPQLELLEAEFAATPFPSRERRHRIAQQLNVTDKSVLVSFHLISLCCICFLQTNRFILKFSGGFKIVVDASANKPRSGLIWVLLVIRPDPAVNIFAHLHIIPICFSNNKACLNSL